jgi:2-oxoglutarate ferredoxin oxidoreductase subunit beta
MTGGQMAPTTLPEMKTTTSPYGRNTDDVGFPIRVCELLNTLVAPYYIERVSLLTPADILKAKKAVSKAIKYNKEGRGFTFVELISTCPTNWGLDPIKSRDWAKENMLPFFKPGCLRDKGEGVE